MKSHLKREDQENIDYMPPVLAAVYQRETKLAPYLLFSVVSFFIIIFIWANWAEVDEITRAEGKVIPSSQIQRISHLEGGIIQEIKIREGDIVQKGQILLKIDNTVAEARYQEGETLYLRYKAAIARLKAQTEGREFVMPAEIEEKAPSIAQEELQRYNARKQKLEHEVAIAEREVEQKRQEFNQLEVKYNQLNEEYDLKKQEIEIATKGLSPKIDVIKLKREAVQLKGDRDSTKVDMSRVQAALTQSLEKLKQVPVNFQNDDFKDLHEMENHLASAKGDFTTQGDRVNRTEVRSPVKGVIKQLLVTTVGGVVKPGEDLIEIVPLEDTLLIEAEVKPSDIAFLRPGLKAIIKITAYDYSIYGSFNAELVQISADTIQNEKKESFYKVQLRTIGNKLSKSHKVLPIIPGMTAQANIMTGKKTVAHYVLKPILKIKDEAFREH